MALIAVEWRDMVIRHFSLYHGAARVSSPDLSPDMLLELLLEHVFAATRYDVKLAEEQFFGD